MRAQTLAFDVYGTLIDTHGVVAALAELAGGAQRAAALSRTWRDKQLEYAYRRALMRRYADFAVCTAQALDYACACHNLPLDAAQKNALLQSYGRLPPFADAAAGLPALQNSGCRLYAFSNGRRAAVDALLTQAGLRDFFIDIVSADDLQTFKPDPALYHHFLRQAGSEAEDSWLISGNPFDVIGALNAGMKAVWLNRGGAFDPWGIEPTVTVAALSELPAVF